MRVKLAELQIFSNLPIKPAFYFDFRFLFEFARSVYQAACTNKMPKMNL